MVTIMDMDTGKIIAEPKPYEDDVLDAGWMPQPLPEPALQVQLQLQEHTHHAPAPSPAAIADADLFLQGVYRYQE